MDISREQLEDAVADGVISTDQAEALWSRWAAGEPERPGGMALLAYYLGALIVISAMGWYLTQQWERLGGWGIAAVALLYAAVFLTAGYILWYRIGLHVAGGLLATLAVWMVPLLVYGIERGTGIWPQGDPGAYANYHQLIRGSWIAMEVTTILAGVVALRFFPFAFLSFPIAFSGWYLSMDLAPLLFGTEFVSMHSRSSVSIAVGVVMLAVAYMLDHRTREDYAHWLYLFGLLAFWGGILIYDWNITRHLWFGLLGLLLLVIGALFRRTVFTVFGALSLFMYLGYLAYEVFANSAFFPVALTIIGLAFIAGGIFLQRYSSHLRAWLQQTIPPHWQGVLPPERRPAR